MQCTNQPIFSKLISSGSLEKTLSLSVIFGTMHNNLLFLNTKIYEYFNMQRQAAVYSVWLLGQ